jgi:hypothetical protein
MRVILCCALASLLRGDSGFAAWMAVYSIGFAAVASALAHRN